MEESGVVSWNMSEGAALTPGNLLASSGLVNQENVTPVSLFCGMTGVEGWGQVSVADTQMPHQLLRCGIKDLSVGVTGYVHNRTSLDGCIGAIKTAVTTPLLPAFEIEEQLSVLSAHISVALLDSIINLLAGFKESCLKGKCTVVPSRYV